MIFFNLIVAPPVSVQIIVLRTNRSNCGIVTGLQKGLRAVGIQPRGRIRHQVQQLGQRAVPQGAAAPLCLHAVADPGQFIFTLTVP